MLCLQGDKRFAEVMGLMGAKVEWSPYSITITGPKAFGQPLKGIDHDCNDIPDAAMTLAVAALFAEVRELACEHARACCGWEAREVSRSVHSALFVCVLCTELSLRLGHVSPDS